MFELHHNNKRTWPFLPPAICIISRFFIKSIVFHIKTFRIKKKENCIFDKMSKFYLIVLLISFFLLLLWITAEHGTKLKKLLIRTTKLGGTQQHKHINCTWLFISNYNNVSDNLDWTWFLHYFWLQEFIQQKTKKFVNK